MESLGDVDHNHRMIQRRRSPAADFLHRAGRHREKQDIGGFDRIELQRRFDVRIDQYLRKVFRVAMELQVGNFLRALAPDDDLMMIVRQHLRQRRAPASAAQYANSHIAPPLVLTAGDDPDRRSVKTKRFPQTVLNITAVGKVQQLRIVDEQNKRRRRDRYLRSIQNL